MRIAVKLRQRKYLAYNPNLYLTPEISTFLMRVIRAKIRYIHCTFEQSHNGPINDAHTHVANEVSNN